MNISLKAAALAALLLTGSGQALAQAAPAATTVPAGPIATGIGVANLQAVLVNANAYKTAATQRQTTYKPQIDQAQARQAQLQAQLNPLVTKFEADRAAATPNQASLQQQAQTIQTLQQSGQAELQRILAPVSLSEAYVEEQISDKLNAAITAAMTKQKVTLLLSPDSVLAASASYNLNQAILNELNTSIPNAQIVPPAGWLPRQVREQQAAQAGQPAPAATPAGTRPATGR